MRFYNRESELELMQKHWELCEESGQMLVVTGRRRGGKTLLAQEFMKDKSAVYFFVSRKSEALLCEEFIIINAVF